MQTIYNTINNYFHGDSVKKLLIEKMTYAFPKKYLKNNTTPIENHVACTIDQLKTLSTVDYLQILKKDDVYSYNPITSTNYSKVGDHLRLLETTNIRHIYPALKNEFIDGYWLHILNVHDKAVIEYRDIDNLKKRIAVFLLLDQQEPVSKNFIKYGNDILFCIVNSDVHILNCERHTDILKNIYIEEYNLCIS